MSMVRTQIYLPEDLYRNLTLYSKKKKINLSEAIRLGIQAILQQSPPKKKTYPLENMIGKGSLGGPKDLYKNIDYYLYEEPYLNKSKKKK